MFVYRHKKLLNGKTHFKAQGRTHEFFSLQISDNCQNCDHLSERKTHDEGIKK